MVRLLLVLLALWSFAGAAGAADAAAPAGDVDSYVAKFNPDIFSVNADHSPIYPMKNAFSTPASDIAADVASNNWFNLFVYLPFLIAPQVLLLVVIFKFRDRGDGRKPATFMTNHKLEALWTIIPILALVIVSVPVAKVLYKMELPPEQVDTNDPRQATVIKVTGSQFKWEYEYKLEGIKGVKTDAGQNQEPLVIVKDRAVLLNITSADVNHAWWVPAFGVKKDAIRGRYTNTWFTPNSLGVFKGNCAELCGSGHGIMFISSVVVTPDEFEVWKSLQHHRADTDKVWARLQPSGTEVDDEKLKAAVAKYFDGDRSDARRFALRYWVAADYQALHRSENFPAMADDLKAHESERRAKIETLVSKLATDAAPVAAQQQ